MEGGAATALAFVALALGLLGFALVGIDRGDDPPPGDTEVVVILGGREDRIPPGMALAQDLGRPLVLSSSAVIFGARFGVGCGPGAFCFQPLPDCTAGEAVSRRRIADQEGWNHLTVVTSSFHAVRARILLRQCRGAERVSVVGVDAPDQNAFRWVVSRVNERFVIVGAVTFGRAC